MPYKLCFVLCPSFHGATLLSALLNNHPSIAALGDTLPIKAHMDYYCSCGDKIQDCDFWAGLTNDIDFLHYDRNCFNADRMLFPMIPFFCQNNYLNQSINRLMSLIYIHFDLNTWKLFSRKSKQFSYITDYFYNQIHQQLGGEYIVDGCKSITRMLSVNKLLGKEIRVVHLLRDPRAFVCSYKKNVSSNSSVKEICKLWLKYHRRITNYCDNKESISAIHVRYEDVCTYTRNILSDIYRFLDVKDLQTPKKQISPHHIIGNRMLTVYDGNITLDEKWKELLSLEDQNRILDYTYPISNQFGYIS